MLYHYGGLRISFINLLVISSSYFYSSYFEFGTYVCG